jgi:predicted transcriptional regulator
MDPGKVPQFISTVFETMTRLERWEAHGEASTITLASMPGDGITQPGGKGRSEHSTPPTLVTRRSAASPQITQRDINDPTGQVDPLRWPGVYADKIICLDDNAEVTLMRPYIRRRLGLSFEQYCEKWNLPEDYPRVPPDYAVKKRAEAQAVGLGLRIRSKKRRRL